MNIKKIEVTSEFWKKYRELIVDAVLPYQWSVMNDEGDIQIADEPGGNPIESQHSHAIANLKIAAGLEEGEFSGYPFQDTDVYKWLEAAAYSFSYHPDDNLKRMTDELIDLLEAAQEEDGYLVSYFQIEAPERKFKRLQQSHELYTMGHYIEAAVAYYEATGNEKALRIAKRMADCIDAHFGVEKGKIPGSDGHPEIELALARLYEVTHEEKYLKLAQYHIAIRGSQSDFYEEQNKKDGIKNNLIDGMEKFPPSYYQSSGPILEQETLDGHAVRVAYLCAGMAHVARLTNDKALAEACNRFWEDISMKRMYITGGIGSTNLGEQFTLDYDLPNDTMYGETCASVGMIFFAKEMLALQTNGKYGDVLEKELFNGALAGMALDGEHFFYVNPLEADPTVSKYNPSRAHVLTKRAEWFGCACCPSNIARLIASVDQYIYQVKEDVVLLDQYISSTVQFDNEVVIKQVNNYPWDNQLIVSIENPKNVAFQLAIRVPNWSYNKFELKLNGKHITQDVVDGFIYLTVTESIQIELTLDMTIQLIQANQNIRYDYEKVALQRGPIVYCTEEVDNGEKLWTMKLKVDGEKEAIYDEHLLEGVVKITAEGVQQAKEDSENSLYHPYKKPKFEDISMTFVPYYTWANREEGQMSVWQNTCSHCG